MMNVKNFTKFRLLFMCYLLSGYMALDFATDNGFNLTTAILISIATFFLITSVKSGQKVEDVLKLVDKEVQNNE